MTELSWRKKTDRWDSVVFVDLDHTVIEGPWDLAVFPTVCSEIALKTEFTPSQVMHLLFTENWDRQRDRQCPAALAMDWGHIAESVAESLGVELEADVLELVQSHAGPPHSRILDHADLVFSRLLRRHRAIVASTKGLERYQRPILKALGLESFFDEILAPDTTGMLKRDRQFYGEWPDLTQLQIIVGDHPQDDVIAPHRFGFKTIWKPRDKEHEAKSREKFAKHSIEPDAIISSLQELPAIVEKLEQEEHLINGD